jgi:hypothetical protein
MSSILPSWGVRSRKQKYIDQLSSNSRKCHLWEDKNKKTSNKTSKSTFSFESTAIVETCVGLRAAIAAKAFSKNNFKNGSGSNQLSK